jgi:hypothetical protein
VPVDDRQRMAAPVTGYGVPAVMGAVAVLTEDGLREMILGKRRAVILLTT